jgi:hypothetical protein
VSKKLAHEVHTVLLNFGIISRLKLKKVKYRNTIRYCYIIIITSDSIGIFIDKIGFLCDRKRAESLVLLGKVRNSNVDVENKYFFDRVILVNKEEDKTYDLVVPETESFVGNGFVNHNTFLLSVISTLYALLYPGKKILLISPSFRQSKIIFDEVEQRYIKSPILREACDKKPTVGADRCYLPFRGVENKPGSLIAAYPLGDGQRIRGLRGHLIVSDEFAQIPEDIFDMVVRPMGATKISPMENVRRISRLKENLDRGILTQEEYQSELAGDSVNKMICVSSAYFQFNHMYKKIKAYEQEIASGSKEYATHYLSYRDMPPGFLEMSNIENARATMSRISFSIEYEGIWESDSDGIFKASLIEQSKSRGSEVKLIGDIGKSYILGVDPARSSDAFAIVVLEIGNPSFVVNAFQIVGCKFPEMAQKIWSFCDKFDVKLIMMDAGSGGGGVAIKDILSNAQFFGSTLILDMEDTEHKMLNGRRIIKMHDPKPNSIAEANYAALNILEQGLLKFPLASFDFSDEKEKVYSDIQEMLRQMMAVTITETKTGQAHFDIPATGTGSRKKDLYSAFVLAAKGLHDTIHLREEVSTYVNKGGLVIPVNRNKHSVGPPIVNIMGFPGRR